MPLETFWYYQNESLLLMHLVQNFSFDKDIFLKRMDKEKSPGNFYFLLSLFLFCHKRKRKVDGLLL